MSYTMASSGVYADMDDVVLIPETTITDVLTTDALEVGSRSCACLDLVCTALSASDTLDVKIQTSKDASGSGLGAWRDVAAFTQLVAEGSERKSFAGLDRFIRVVATPADGSTNGVSATLSVRGELKG